MILLEGAKGKDVQNLEINALATITRLCPELVGFAMDLGMMSMAASRRRTPPQSLSAAKTKQAGSQGVKSSMVVSSTNKIHVLQV